MKSSQGIPAGFHPIIEQTQRTMEALIEPDRKAAFEAYRIRTYKDLGTVATGRNVDIV